MTTFEPKPNSPRRFLAQEKLDFMVPFDGAQAEVSETERKAAADMFKKAAEQVVTTYADLTQGMQLMTYLAVATHFEDKSSLLFVVTSSAFLKGTGGPGMKVRVIERDTEQKSRGTYSYELSNDETTVRRVNIGDIAEISEGKRLPMIRHENIQGADMHTDSPLYDAVQNTLLEEQLGFNNQPVGVPEVEKLTSLLLSANPVLS